MSAVDQGLDAAVQRVEDVLIEHRIVIVSGGALGERYRCEAEDCLFDTEDWTSWEEHVAAEVARAAREDVPAREQQARADAWDEGWATCSDWWHAGAIGESHTVDPTNPYRAAAIREGKERSRLNFLAISDAETAATGTSVIGTRSDLTALREGDH